MLDSTTWLPAVAWNDSYVNPTETCEQQEVGRSVTKKRASKAKAIEQLAEDTITFTEPISNFPADRLREGDTKPLKLGKRKSAAQDSLPLDDTTSNTEGKPQSIKISHALAVQKRCLDEQSEEKGQAQAIKNADSAAVAAKVDLHGENSDEGRAEKRQSQKKKKSKEKPSTATQSAGNRHGTAQVVGDETQHGSEAVQQAKELLLIQDRSQLQDPAAAKSDRKNPTVQQQKLKAEQQPSVGKTGQKKGKISTLDKMKAQLQGGRFRMLNEKLYTTEGDEAFQFMQGSPELFTLYHEGFRVQAKSWTKNPVNLALKWLRTKPDGWTVADFGCGDAQIAQELSKSHTVHSFDLCAGNEHVTACNMANVPCKSGSCNAAIFSLALMGTDYGKFLLEAHRVLKTGGFLWIAEVRSRFVPENGDTENFAPFLASLQKAGFKALKQDVGNKMFVVWVAKKVKDDIDSMTVQWPVLKPCIYKRR